MGAQPIKPSDVVAAKKTSFPDAVLEAFNELIAQNFSNGQATVVQDEVVQLMIQKGLKRGDIFNKNWLDVEEVYEAADWKVSYDKPGYNEDYSATFTFKNSSRRNSPW